MFLPPLQLPFRGTFPLPIFPSLSSLFPRYPLAPSPPDDATDASEIPVTIEQVNLGDDAFEGDINQTPKYNCKPGRECVNCTGDRNG